MMDKRKRTDLTSCDTLRTWLCLGLVVTCLAGVSGASSLYAQEQPGNASNDAPPVRGERPTSPEQTPQVRGGDPFDSFLRSIDPKQFNISQDTEMEIFGDQIIFRGNENDLDMVELFIAALEAQRENKELRVVTVTKKDAHDIADTLQAALPDMLDEPNQREELKLSITALSANIMLVSALPDKIDFIVDLIATVDETEGELPDAQELVFPIKHRRAADVAEQLKEIVGKMQEKVGATGAKYEIQIIPINASNSIMVLAPESERVKLQRLINEIDVEPVKGWGEVKLTLFPLLHSKANEMEGVITELLESQQGTDAAEEVVQRLQISRMSPITGEVEDLPAIDLQKPTSIFADEGTNSLIVATVEENVGPLGELIRLLDGVPMAEDVQMKLFPLRYADAEGVAELLKQITDGGGELTEDPDGSGQNAVPDSPTGKALVYNVGIHPDVRTNTLIVTGRAEHITLVEGLIADLDQPATALKWPLRFITLEHTDAPQVGDIVSELFDQRLQAVEATEAGKMTVERERVFLSVDVRSNSLIISASEENYAEILTIARQLDNRPAKLFDQIRILRCERLNADDTRQKIEDLWQRKAELRREEDILMDLPVVVVDERSNSLVIASTVEDFEEIRRLIEKLESAPLINDTQLFKLAYADAEVVASMLDELFQGMAGGSDTFEAPTVLPDPRSNAIVGAGSRDAMERVADLVARLDVEAGPLTASFHVYRLEHASSVQLSERMQELFDSRSEGQDITRTPIVILPDETSNSLVCSASRDDHEQIASLLALLDQPSNLARQFEIFPLEKARATVVAEKLEALFASQGGSGSGRLDAIATEADERTNSVVVWASPSQMANIREVMVRFDTSTPAIERTVKVIQLRQALAEEFAELLTRTLAGEDAGSDNERAVILSWLEEADDGTHAIRKLLREDIRIEADPRTNSLMVVAPADSISMLEAMIRDFDAIRPIRSELRLFPLINADAQAMADQLSELFQTDGSGGSDGTVQDQLVFGDTIGDIDMASVGQELRFAADIRTNTLIAAGAEVDLRMAEELIQYLDSQAAETRMLDVVNANYMPADEIATAIQGINDQEESVMGEVEGEEAAAQRIKRKISVESVGNAEEGSSKLIIGTSRHRYQETMDLISRLDRPEPQVRISVIIAEVKLTDSFEFGMEFAGQQLDFSLNAGLGPNGIVRGSDFDFVGGTQLGAAGLGIGGFNFTMTGEDFSFLFHAIQQNSHLEVLSRPTLLVRNGDEGNITIADQVPIVTSSQLNDTGSTNTSVGREDVGFVLNATPHISPDGFVTIELRQEISNFAGENLQLTEGVSAPIFSTREVETNVTIRDGETVVIGGLITERQSDGVNKVPILGDLPWIGPMFRSTSISKDKTELLIAMTVEVIRTSEDAQRMSVAERDRSVLPSWMAQHPLLEGIRIKPDPTLMGPNSLEGKPGGASEPIKRPDHRELYGPKPKTYGPNVPRSKPTATTQAQRFGPKIVRNENPTVEGTE